MSNLAVFSLLVSAFMITGCVALVFEMVREIRHYRALKARHAENVKRLAGELPMMRTAVGVDVARAVVAGKENYALRQLCVALIGYTYRLEKELKRTSAPLAIAEVLDSAPPILELTTAIREREWAEFDDIIRGIPRAKRSGPRSTSC